MTPAQAREEQAQRLIEMAKEWRDCALLANCEEDKMADLQTALDCAAGAAALRQPSPIEELEALKADIHDMLVNDGELLARQQMDALIDARLAALHAREGT